MPDPTGDPTTALARDLDRVSRRVEEIAQRVGDVDGLRTQLTRLAQEVTRKTAPKTGATAPPSWLAQDDPQVAGDVLRDLLVWLDAVYLRYPLTALPTCWLWHPWALEELVWLHAAHTAAYDPERGSISAVADWHERHRPGVADRLRKALGDCDLADHVPGQRAAAPAHTAPLQHAHDAVAFEWINSHSTPEPTGFDLSEAEHHDQHHHAA